MQFTLRIGRKARSSASSDPLRVPTPAETASTLRRDARTRGRRAGRAAAFGQPHADRIEDLPGRILLEKSTRSRQQHARELVLLRRRSLKARVRERADLIEKAAGGAETASKNAAQTKHSLAALPLDQSPNVVSYVFVLLLLAAAEYPTLASALRVFPFDATTRQALAYILSGVLAVAAHYLAKRIRVLVDSRGAPWGARLFQGFFVGLFVLVIVGLMVAMSVTRGEAFNQIATLTGGAFGDPTLLALLMLAVQVTLFVVALAVGLQHADGARRRQTAKQLRRAERDVRKANARHEALVAEKTTDEEELKTMSETERLYVEREDELLGELIARHDHAYEAAEHSFWTRLVARIIAPRVGTTRA